MSDGTLLIDRAYFESEEWRNQRRDGLGRGAAWLDLLGLTNQKATTMEPRGLRIHLERGQCGWSMKGLADRWGWGQGKVSAQLQYWEEVGRITRETTNQTTIISVTNYDCYQKGLLELLPKTEPNLGANSAHDQEQTGSRPGADREQIVTEKGEGRREKGKGGAEPPTENETNSIPDDEAIAEFCAKFTGDLARGIPAQIPEGWWTGWVSHQLAAKKWPADWKRVLLLAFRADFIARHPKALGHLPVPAGKKNAVAAPGGRSAAQERFVLEKELEAVRERLDACHEVGAPPEAQDVVRERELEQRLTAMESSI